jgi:tetratricopeptide (TPR) repeat protein
MSARPYLTHPLFLRLRSVCTVLSVLFLLGVVTRPIEAPAWQVVKAGQPEMNLEAIEGALGQGLVVGVLGGFRAVMADFLWIRTNTIWERRDRVKLDAMVRLVTTLDPRPEFFWINGARMIAYDVPNWRIKEEGGYDAVPESRQQALDREQAEQAFVMLERAREFHPNQAKLYLEVAQIYLNRLKDVPHAAEWFLRASQMPDAPYYAARIYGELLRRQGKDAQAYEFLKQLHGELPDDPYAQRPIILDRIRELEKVLKIPVWQRYQPQAAVPVVPEVRLEEKVRAFEQAHSHDDCHDHAH